VSHDVKPFVGSLVCLVVGVAAHKADLNRAFCWPTSFLQGHAFWHCATALSLHFIYLHLRSERWSDFQRKIV